MSSSDQTTSPALKTALAYLNAREHGPHVIWRDDVVGHDVYADRDDVERFGEMLEFGARAAYSVWCSEADILDWLHVDTVEVEHLGSNATGADLEPYAKAVVEALAAAGVDADYTVSHDVDDEPCAVAIVAHCDHDTYRPVAERALGAGW